MEQVRERTLGGAGLRGYAVAVAHLAEHLRLAEHQRIEPCRNAEQVAHRIAVMERVEMRPHLIRLRAKLLAYERVERCVCGTGVGQCDVGFRPAACGNEHAASGVCAQHLERARHLVARQA